MNKPITNRVKRAPNSPAKETTAGGLIMEDVKQGEGTPDQVEEVTVREPRKTKSWENAYKDVDKTKYPTLESFKKAGKKWWDDNPDKKYVEHTETKVTPGTPGETTRTTYKPEIVKNQTQTTPWENRWADRIADQQVREGRQDARRELRKIGVEEFKTMRREGAGLRDAFKGMRDVQTGRGNLSGYERDLYETKRGLKKVEEAQAAENAYRTLATRGDNVKTVHDFTTADAGTTEGGNTLKNYETTLGGKPKIEPGNAASPQSWDTGINDRKKSRETAAFAADASAASAENARTKRLAKEAKAGMESDIVGKMPKGNDGTIDSKGNPTDKAKSLDDITLKAKDTKLESVPENDAPFRPLPRKNKPEADLKSEDTKLETVPEAPDNATFDASYLPENKVAKAGMEYEGTKLETVPGAPDNAKFSGDKIIADRKAKALAQANSMKENTGTADRSSYDRTSPPLVDGTPTRENRPPMTPAQKRYQSNVGMQTKSALKKGYFKNK